ncbi:monocarboxylate transporter 1-like [Lytechinus variegatus]|uniref:monocarboxylate transporter 1-like n=1 Tax=Lytechinus variegatus TaxID=7654 RepID=UPI001BB1C2C8|nr:monocarboxylate transporter 1-like [Lytechinus variegatus]XP_041475595.1 monocarboxylate transporter 1-like [Lytechinus variegatus]
MEEGSETTDKWRYVVALGKFFVHLIFPGMTKALSVLVPAMVFQLQVDYTTVGFLVPMQYGVLYVACPLSNYLATKFGHRCVSSIGGFLSGVSMMGAFFSQSAMTIGISFFFTGLFSSPLRQSSTVMLREHFGEKYGVAITFTQMGGLLGGVILPYVTALCLDAYGMRGAMLCLSGIFFYHAAIGATFRAPRSPTVRNNTRHVGGEEDIEGSTLLQGQEDEIYLRENNLRHDDESISTYDNSRDECWIPKDGEAQKSNPTRNLMVEFLTWILPMDFMREERIFIFLFIPCYILDDISFAIWIIFSPSYGVSVGLDEKEAVYLPIVGSLGGFVGRLVLIGILYKHPHLTPHAFSVNAAVSSIAMLAHPLSSSLVHLLICSFFAGFGFYGLVSSFYATLPLRLKNDNFPIASSIIFLTSGVILLLSGTLAGLFYEHFGSFKTVFIAMGVFSMISCVVFSSYLFVDAMLKRRPSTEIG